jgi:hypothetical protein
MFMFFLLSYNSKHKKVVFITYFFTLILVYEKQNIKKFVK